MVFKAVFFNIMWVVINETGWIVCDSIVLNLSWHGFCMGLPHYCLWLFMCPYLLSYCAQQIMVISTSAFLSLALHEQLISHSVVGLLVPFLLFLFVNGRVVLAFSRFCGRFRFDATKQCVNEERSAEWELVGESEVARENLCRYKSCMVWLGLEHGTPLWEVCD
jgi:hypothetical protein